MKDINYKLWLAYAKYDKKRKNRILENVPVKNTEK